MEVERAVGGRGKERDRQTDRQTDRWGTGGERESDEKAANRLHRFLNLPPRVPPSLFVLLSPSQPSTTLSLSLSLGLTHTHTLNA